MILKQRGAERSRSICRASIVLILTCLPACHTSAGREHDKPSAATSQGPAEDAFRYPGGSWWRDSKTTSRFTFAAAHILISHRDASPNAPFDWIVNRAATRTREQAVKLATELGNELRQKPSRFGELALRYSDDRGSASRGGRLGVLRAPRVPMEVVDAAGYLKAGEISKVLETPSGFHLLQRMEVPPEVTVAAQEIVIGYEGVRANAPRPGRSTSRTRAEAEAIASKVAAEAKKDPGRFAELVQQYSDSQLAVDGGDYGTWSNLDFFAESVVVAALSEAEMGGVVEPLDSPAGFKILKRTPPAERPWLVASQIVIGHEQSPVWRGEAPPKRSREQARELAVTLLGRLKADPSAFDSLQSEHPSNQAGPRIWWQVGNGVPGMSHAVSSARVGAVVDELTETPLGFHLLRRDSLEVHPVGPDDPRVPSPVFELPNPPLPALVEFLKTTPADRLTALVHQFRREASQDLGLSGEPARAFEGVYERLLGDLPKLTLEGRALRMEHTADELVPLLSTEQLTRFFAFRKRWFGETLRM